MFKALHWKRRDINIDGKYPSHLRFADDIVLVAETVQDLQCILGTLAESSAHIGLWMNWDKTRIIFNEHVISELIILNGLSKLYICLVPSTLAKLCS